MTLAASSRLRALSLRLGRGPASAPPTAKARLQTFADAFTALRTIVTTGLLGILLALVLYGLLSEFSRGDVIIEPIGVPETLQKAGWTKEVAARRLQDRIARLTEQSMTDKAPSPIASGPTRPDFTVPGTTFTARTLVEFVRDFLGVPARKVSGEIVVATSAPKSDGMLAALRTSLETSKPKPDQVRMTMRMSLGKAERIFSREGSLDEVLDGAALDLLKELDPYTAASYFAFRRRDMEQALGMVYRMLGQPEGEVRRVIYPPHSPSRPANLHWIYLMWAYILSESGRPDEAIAKFEQANEAYRKADPLSQGWALALDGEGAVLMRQGKTQEARKRFYRVVTRVDAGYASSWYNLGRTYLDEHELLLGKRDICEARSAFAAATNIDPRSAIAWEGWGTTLLEQIRRMRYGDDPGGVKPPEFCLRGKTIEQLEAEAESLFARAVGADPTHVAGWTQWGVMEFQKGEAAFWAGASATERDEKNRLFEEGGRQLQDAMGKLTRALALNPMDGSSLDKLAKIVVMTDQR